MPAMMRSYGRAAIVFPLLALLVGGLAACGGDDDDGENPFVPGVNQDSDNDDTDADSNGDDPDGDADDDSSSLPQFGDGGTAVVTIDGERYEAILSNRTVNGRDTIGFCRDVFGGLQIQGYAETDDGRVVQVEMWIPPTDWESYDDGRYDPPTLEISINDAEGPRLANWLADQEHTTFQGNSQVDDYELEGTRASGSVTFTDEFSREPRPVAQGTFEVNCE